MAIEFFPTPSGTGRFEDGTYTAELLRVEGPYTSRFANDRGEYPEQVKLVWRLVDGPGDEIFSYANFTMAARSKLRQICTVLLGHDIPEDKPIGPRDVVGKQCQVVLALNDNGYPRVTQYLKAKKGRPAFVPVADEEDVSF